MTLRIYPQRLFQDGTMNLWYASWRTDVWARRTWSSHWSASVCFLNSPHLGFDFFFGIFTGAAHIKLNRIDSECKQEIIGTDSCINTIREAVRSGINLIDTSPYYGAGASEIVVGQVSRLQYLFSVFSVLVCVVYGLFVYKEYLKEYFHFQSDLHCCT